MARPATIENAVMELLWDEDGAWLTPTEVRACLAQELAQTTVGTVMVRLWRKGRLERRRRGKGYEYRPTQGREEYAAARMSEILGVVADRSVALHRFVELLPADERDDLRELLEGE